jgi:hypothetical protein
VVIFWLVCVSLLALLQLLLRISIKMMVLVRIILVSRIVVRRSSEFLVELFVAFINVVDHCPEGLLRGLRHRVCVIVINSEELILPYHDAIIAFLDLL